MTAATEELTWRRAERRRLARSGCIVLAWSLPFVLALVAVFVIAAQSEFPLAGGVWVFYGLLFLGPPIAVLVFYGLVLIVTGWWTTRARRHRGPSGRAGCPAERRNGDSR